ncbi:G-protein coupled receptor [Biomphalaria glabrata]|nr:putative G-protein coupled receptor [Biomphalaria glabrata]
MSPTYPVTNNVTLNYQTTTLVMNTPNAKVYILNVYCFIGSQDYFYLFQAFSCFVNPVLSVLGLFINALCLVILAKSGLKKTSNILLFALVLADSMNMFINLDFPTRIRYFGPLKYKSGLCTFEYDTIMNEFLYVSQHFFSFVGLWGRTINASIPMIITIERILAVYFPVTFKKVVTTRSITASCCAAYIIWLPHVIVQTFYRRLEYIRLPNGKVAAITTQTEFLINNYSILYTFTVYAMEVLLSWVPTCFISLGCILIGIKISVSISQRRKMTNVNKKRQWSPRTTRTLLTTCLIFAVTHAITALISALVVVDTKTPLLSYLLEEISQFINILNCTSNFLIYFLFNKKLWKIFLQIVCPIKKSNIDKTFFSLQDISK